MNDTHVIYAYTLQQAIADGVQVELFHNHWPELSGGKPIVATVHLYHDIDVVVLQGIWNEYVDWKQHIMPTLPEEDRLFSTWVCGRKAWVLEDVQAYTLLYPEDY